MGKQNNWLEAKAIIEGGIDPPLDPKGHEHLLSHLMLGEKTRQYVIEKVKAPLLKAIVTLATRYPEPTIENTEKHNSHVLIAIRDRFFEHNRILRNALFRALWRVLISEYEHDLEYSARIDFLVEALVKEVQVGNWKPRHPRRPHEPYWIEDRTTE